MLFLGLSDAHRISTGLGSSIVVFTVIIVIIRVEHYEQRLKAIYYKKKFSERMSDVKLKIEG